MTLLHGWKAWRTFNKLPWEWRNVVFYSESGQDWHQFSGLIGELNRSLARKVCYVTSDPDDPGLGYEHEYYRAIFLPAGLFLIAFFQLGRSDAFVLTMMDLNNLHLKRSLFPAHYIYLFHSMGSTHMADHANSFDSYDSLFCCGPHQVKEIRRREELYGLPAKHLFEYGHPRLEQVMREGGRYRDMRSRQPGESKGPAVVLVAPTWGETSLFNVCGAELIGLLLGVGFRVVMRPHYQSTRLDAGLIEGIRAQYQGHAGFEYVGHMSESDSLLSSDVLISDWSAMAIEYALGLEKPVLFVDVPRRVRNPDWQELGLEPLEASIRDKVGVVVPVQRLADVPTLVQQLIENSQDFSERMKVLRDQTVFRLGHSLQDGAEEIARLADIAQGRRLQGNPGHG